MGDVFQEATCGLLKHLLMSQYITSIGLFINGYVYTLLNDPKELTSFIDKIVDLPNQSIYEVIQSIPSPMGGM
jgi:hypothetical protein